MMYALIGLMVVLALTDAFPISFGLVRYSFRTESLTSFREYCITLQDT